VSYVLALAFVALAALTGAFLERIIDLPNVSIVFLFAVLGAAVGFGTWPAVAAAVASFLAYNFFFVEPRYSFTVARPHELLALVVFLAVGLATSALAGRVRDQARVARDRTKATRRLYDVTRRLSGAATIEQVAEVAAAETSAGLARTALVFVADGPDLRLQAMWPPSDDLDAAASAAARWARDHDEPAGHDTATLPNVPWLFLPLRASGGVVGVMGVQVGPQRIDTEARALLDALAEQTGAALERASLAREIGAVKARAETERVRNTLLASISHDFRTPLASILGAATSLSDLGERLTPATRDDLLGQIQDEARHLDRMVRDLLWITRLESGSLELRRDWLDLRETAQRIVEAERRRRPGRTITLDAGQVPLVRADATLIEQAITNLVENALVHGGAEARVEIALTAAGPRVEASVTDDGVGIPADMLGHVFEKFVTAPTADMRAGQGSAGLGLAIARGVVEAHGGTIRVESPASGGRGARFVVSLPLEADGGRT
jgi:two-component system sensor histidine kinase KdpD